MKKSVSLLITALLLCTLTLPALASEETPSVYYPISVEEYTYGPLDEFRIDKVYQLSLDDDPGGIPTEDGYTETLHLDHTSVQVTTDGYATRTGNVSASRTYPNPHSAAPPLQTATAALGCSLSGRTPTWTGARMWLWCRPALAPPAVLFKAAASLVSPM